MISVITPAYNRADNLIDLYNSLLRQKYKDFEWIIVDDGSSDGTKAVCEDFVQRNQLRCSYYYKENGGKHTAVNFGIRQAEGNWCVIVDSDDFFIDDAFELVAPFLKLAENFQETAGVVALKKSMNGKISGNERESDNVLYTDFFSYRAKYKKKGERIEFIKTQVMKEFPFPEIYKEKFCSEALVWNRIAKKHKCVFVNKALLIIGDYMEGGLTKMGKKLFLESPNNSLLYFKEACQNCGNIFYFYWALGEYWSCYRHAPNRNDKLLLPTSKMKRLRFLTIPYSFIKRIRDRYFK